jgi:hypothetical protein
MRKQALLFVNKKKQKNFFLSLLSALALADRHPTGSKGEKFFASFFQKRRRLLALEPRLPPAGIA